MKTKWRQAYRMTWWDADNFKNVEMKFGGAALDELIEDIRESGGHSVSLVEISFNLNSKELVEAGRKSHQELENRYGY